MYKGFLHTHYLVVIIFLLIYVVKTILLLSDKKELLASFTKKTRIVEMIVSALFLITGIYLTMHLPFQGKYDYLFYIKVCMVLASIPIAIIGFKRGNKILAALSLLLITGSFGIAEVYVKKKNVPKDALAAAPTTDAKAGYEGRCGMCHGVDGKLGMAGAKDISATMLDAATIKDIILHGRNSMMPVIGVEDEEAALIADYVFTTIRKGPSPGLTPAGTMPDSVKTGN